MATGSRESGRRRVAIVGAGMAGLTAAMRLLEAGGHVVLIEKGASIGGKFGAVYARGAWHEHAYHFFASWCLNFWDVVHAIGLSRARDFEMLPGYMFLRRRGGYTEFRLLSSPEAFLANVFSGVLPWQDVLIYFYSILDLLSDTSVDREEFLNRVSVNGYMRSRPYATDGAALLHQEGLLKAFAVPVYEISVRAYQTFLQFLALDDAQVFFVLKGDSHTRFMQPFERRLRRLGEERFDLRLSTEVTRIQLDERGVRAITVQSPSGGGRIPCDGLIVAVPPEALRGLVEGDPELYRRAPELLDLRRLRSRQMASLDLHFRRVIPGIPRQHVTLIDPDARHHLDYKTGLGSRYALSFVDNAQLWGEPDATFLNVVASDYDPLAGLPDDRAQAHMLEELRRYLPFTLDDIDESRTYFQAHRDAPLFSNSVGSWEFRPEIRLEKLAQRTAGGIPNLFLAGDYCRSKIDIVCVEGAISTGMLAARAAAEHLGLARLPPPPKEPAKAGRDRFEDRLAYLKGWVESVRSTSGGRRGPGSS
jgi:protoporphyrinogen oxidase